MEMCSAWSDNVLNMIAGCRERWKRMLRSLLEVLQEAIQSRPVREALMWKGHGLNCRSISVPPR
jgi:hypothetical protein